MAYLFMCDNITLVEKRIIEDKFRSNLEQIITNGTNCQLWSGHVDRYGYGVWRFVFRGRRLALPAHRVNYFIFRGFLRLHRSFHVSHRCHNKLCVKTSHLSLEPQRVNNSRRLCLLDGICHGHRGYSRCILN